MTSATRWIIGRGLLGRAIDRVRPIKSVPAPVNWGDADESVDHLTAAASRLSDAEGPLEVYWCAGRGVTSTPSDVLEAEVDVFTRALDRFAAEWAGRNVRFFLASSVGGAYALSERPPFTEFTTPAPGSAYGRAKLEMERALTSVTAEHGWRSLIARITNLYGPGQDMAKGQGLISVIVDSYVSGRPVSLYVSLDTLRDYIYEDDCARVVDAGMRRLARVGPGTTTTKIVGSMDAVSIGAILGESTRLRRQRSRIVLGQGPSQGQASDLRVRSVVWPDLDGLVRTTFAEGLDKVYRARLSAFGARS